MAAKHYRYKKDSLQITMRGSTAKTITGVTGMNWSRGGQTVDLISDASELVQEMPIGNLKGSISISTIAQEWAAGDDLDIDACEIVFAMEQVRSGRGAVSAATITVTAANAVITSLSGGVAGAAGEASSIEAEVGDNGSGVLLAFS